VSVAPCSNGAHARVATLGIRVVVVIDDSAAGGPLDEQRDAPLAQRAQTVFQRRKRIGGERRRWRERAL
jgi:hypothetical protein